MITPKIGLRNEILELKKQYTITKDTEFLIRSAILKGIYYALGGTKVIPLPPRYSSITRIIKAVAKVGLNPSGEIEKDIKKLGTELYNETEKRVKALMIYNSNILVIQIKDMLTNQIIINLQINQHQDSIETYQLAEIANSLINIYYGQLNLSAYIDNVLKNCKV